jgi:transposase-like protein
VRWTAQRKAELVVAITAGRIDAATACRQFGVDAGELAAWCEAFERFGIEGLKVTRTRAPSDARTAGPRMGPRQA